MKMRFGRRHLACGCVRVINIFSFGIHDSRRGDPMETQLRLPFWWFLAPSVSPVSCERVDWADRKSQERGAAARSQDGPSRLREEPRSFCRYFERSFRGQRRSMLVDFCVGGELTSHRSLSGKRES